jgi:hypothetical protein
VEVEEEVEVVELVVSSLLEPFDDPFPLLMEKKKKKRNKYMY